MHRPGINLKAFYSLLIILFPTFSCAASFDCVNSSSKVEHIICDNPPVSSLDEQLSREYNKAINRVDNPDELRADQKIWIAQIRDKCQDMLCVYRSISDRVTLLTVSKKNYVSQFAGGDVSQGFVQQDKQVESNRTIEVAENVSPQEKGRIDNDAHQHEPSEVMSESARLSSDDFPPEQVVSNQIEPEVGEQIAYVYQSQNIESQSANTLNLSEHEVRSQRSWFTGLIQDIKDILIAVCVGAMLWVFVSGAMNNWVIYYDKKDVWISLSSIVVTLVAYYLFTSTLFETSFLNFVCNSIVAPIVGLFAIGLIHLNFQYAIKHNGSLYIGLLIGVFKLLFTAFISLSMVLQFDRLLSAKTKKEAALAIFFIFILGWMARTAVNGTRVYSKLGRELPEKNLMN